MPKLLLVANVSKEHIRKFHIPLIELLKESNWTVDVACRMDEPVPEAHNSYDLPCDRNPFRGGINQSVKILKNILEKNDYDILLCNTIVGSIAARLAAGPFRRKGLKVIYLNHGLHFFPGASAGRWAMGYPMEKLLAPKTRNSRRTIHMCDVMWEHMKERYARRQEEEKEYADLRYQNRRWICDVNGELIPSTDMVNCLYNGRLQTPHSLKYATREIKDMLRIEFKYHYLRHTYGTMLAEMNTPTHLLCNQMGHGNIHVTQRYYLAISQGGIDILRNKLNQL